MADEDYTFTQARVRLEDIVAQVRKKDVTLEQSIELLEEGVRLANKCTELSDHTEWRSVAEDESTETAAEGQSEPLAEESEVLDEPAEEPRDAAAASHDVDGDAEQSTADE